uniref:MFS transporter n=1 Tax=Ignisphaera aggregans TaxID=334771 RepID=A0A7C4BDG2_9CREN
MNKVESAWGTYYRIWVTHSILYSFSTSISITYYQAYAIKVLGFSVNEIGVTTFLNLAAISLGNAIGVVLLNRARHRRVLLWKIFASLNLIFWALTGFSDLVASYTIYIFVFIAQLGGAIGGLAYSDTIADVIPRSRAVEVFGRVNAYTLSSSVAGLSIATVIFLFLDVREAYRIIYVISLITAVISAGILYLVADLVRRENTKLSLKQFYKKVSGVISNAAVKHYTMFVSLFTFFVNIPGALWNYYIIKVFGGTEMWISLNTISSTLANAIGNYVFGRASSKASYKRILTCSTIPISLVPLLFLFSNSLEKQVLLNIFAGLSWSAYNLITGVYNLYLAGEDRVYMISLLGILTNTFAAISTRLGAAIASMNMLAMQLMFLVSFIGRITMYIIARKLVAEI